MDRERRIVGAMARWAEVVLLAGVVACGASAEAGADTAAAAGTGDAAAVAHVTDATDAARTVEAADARDEASAGLVLARPAAGLYHAAYPNLGDPCTRVTAKRTTSFERHAGKHIAWVYFSNSWTRGITFPAAAFATIHKLGRVPYVRLMPWTSFTQGTACPCYSMQKFIDGRFDTQLRVWARKARDLGYPILAEFGVEVNGSWFPWNGRWNGGGTTNGYGDPSYPDGPERFRDAYRRIIDLFRSEGALNITWVFHVNWDSWPQKWWNRYRYYYPGDEYIDWIGVSCYGAILPGDDWLMFRHEMDSAYGELTALSATRPLAVLEWGIVKSPRTGDGGRWIAQALPDLAAGRWPRVRAESFWSERWQNEDGSWSDLRIDATPRSLRAYRRGVASAAFVPAPLFTPRP